MVRLQSWEELAPGPVALEEAQQALEPQLPTGGDPQPRRTAQLAREPTGSHRAHPQPARGQVGGQPGPAAGEDALSVVVVFRDGGHVEGAAAVLVHLAHHPEGPGQGQPTAGGRLDAQAPQVPQSTGLAVDPGRLDGAGAHAPHAAIAVQVDEGLVVGAFHPQAVEEVRLAAIGHADPARHGVLREEGPQGGFVFGACGDELQEEASGKPDRDRAFGLPLKGFLEEGACSDM